jgi:hypothetical protein
MQNSTYTWLVAGRSEIACRSGYLPCTACISTGLPLLNFFPNNKQFQLQHLSVSFLETINRFKLYIFEHPVLPSASALARTTAIMAPVCSFCFLHPWYSSKRTWHCSIPALRRHHRAQRVRVLLPRLSYVWHSSQDNEGPFQSREAKGMPTTWAIGKISTLLQRILRPGMGFRL